MCGVIASDTKSGRWPSQITVTTIGCGIERSIVFLLAGGGGIGVADRTSQRKQRAIERRRDAVPFAGCDDSAGERLDFQGPTSHGVEVHRGAGFRRIGE